LAQLAAHGVAGADRGAEGDLDLGAGGQGPAAGRLGQGAEEGLQGDRAVGDRAAELGGGGRLLVDVDRVVVAGDVGVAVDRLLADRFGGGRELRGAHDGASSPGPVGHMMILRPLRTWVPWSSLMSNWTTT